MEINICICDDMAWEWHVAYRIENIMEYIILNIYHKWWINKIYIYLWIEYLYFHLIFLILFFFYVWFEMA